MQQLAADVPSIVRAASRQLNCKSPKTRAGVFQLLKELVVVAPVSVTKEIDLLMTGIISALNVRPFFFSPYFQRGRRGKGWIGQTQQGLWLAHTSPARTGAELESLGRGNRTHHRSILGTNRRGRQLKSYKSCRAFLAGIKTEKWLLVAHCFLTYFTAIDWEVLPHMA